MNGATRHSSVLITTPLKGKGKKPKIIIKLDNYTSYFKVVLVLRGLQANGITNYHIEAHRTTSDRIGRTSDHIGSTSDRIGPHRTASDLK